MKTLRELQDAVIKERGETSWARITATICGHEVTATIDRAMINRGMATGTADRWTWKLDGKRIALHNLIEIVPFS